MRTHSRSRHWSGRWHTVRWCVISLAMVMLMAATGWSQDRKFPYEAVVDLDAEYIRCGPGPKYYPTDKLPRGQTVTVVRHDPGGWAMIAPPPESFSWINAEYVQRLDNNRGTVTANNIIVHVGSKLGDERSVYQRTLSKNDGVEILSETKVVTERGPVMMYRIKPPPREYRWIATKALVPASAFKGGPAGAPLKPPAAPLPNITGPIALETEFPVIPAEDPFTLTTPVSTAPVPTGPAMSAPIVATPVSNGPALGLPKPQPSPSTPLVGTIDPHRSRFYEIDEQMRAMLQRDPLEWNLAAVERDLLELDKQPIPPNLHVQIQSRLKHLQKYAKMQQDFLDLHQLTSETKRRDAELLSLQRQTDDQLRLLESGQVTSPNSQPAPTPIAQPTPIPVSSPTTRPAPVTPRPTPRPAPPVNPGARPPVAAPAPRSAAPPAVPKFDGAGIVQKRSDDGKPAYAIVAPDGRLLAYLQAPPELDLAPYVNFQMGVIGDRAFDAAVNADVIQVRGLQPVQLRQ